MASDDMKKLRKEYTKEGIRKSQMAMASGSGSGSKAAILKCGRCKKTNCTYNQVSNISTDLTGKQVKALFAHVITGSNSVGR